MPEDDLEYSIKFFKKVMCMIRLLILSDDFTGALDTGVLMAVKGASTYVTFASQLDLENLDRETDVLVIDAETRHLKQEDAYRVIFSIVKTAEQIGIPYIYKKTDSALRGNIGAELTAAIEAGSSDHIHFIPAFPQMGRTTIDGVHYVNGVPIAESIFGRDPFEPVRYSSIPEIIASQSDIPVRRVGKAVNGADSGRGIRIYDSDCDNDFEAISEQLIKKGDLHLMAGCAGFAAMLPKILKLNGKPPQMPILNDRMLVACGSVNPVSVAQCGYAEENGALRFRLSPEQKLSPERARERKEESLLREISTAFKSNSLVILDTNGPGDPQNTDAYAARMGIPSEVVRTSVVSVMSYLLKDLLDDGLNATIFIMGGDLLFQFVQQAGIKVISPIREIECGVVLSQLSYQGRKLNIVSKSGGFGDKELFVDLWKKIHEGKYYDA